MARTMKPFTTTYEPHRIMTTAALCGFTLLLGGCSLRVFAAATTAALDVYSTAYIEAATPAERVELRDALESIKPYTDQAKASVDAKLALIAALDEGN